MSRMKLYSAAIYLIGIGSILSGCGIKTEEEREKLCETSKSNFRRDMFCSSLYDIGQGFLEDPTSNSQCSDQEVMQTIKLKSSILKVTLNNSCKRDDIDKYARDILSEINRSGLNISECGMRPDGGQLRPEVDKFYSAFLACRRYQNSR